MFIGDLIGISEEQWKTLYMDKEITGLSYIFVGIYLYTLQKDNLNDKILKEFS
jgi:hypothetical protein